MRTLIVIRHGQSDQHVRDITGGWTDTSLTDLGRQQAHLTGRRLVRLLEDRPARLLSSDLVRAADTARIIGQIIGAEPLLHAELREINNGQAANLTRQQARVLEQPITQPIHDWVPYPGGESWRMMAERVFAFMDFMHTTTADTAIVVTHGNPGVAVIQWWLGINDPCRPNISFQLDPASVTVLGINFWEERTIVRLNDTSHLGKNQFLLGEKAGTS